MPRRWKCEYITACNFGDRRMSGFETPLPVAGRQRKPGLNSVDGLLYAKMELISYKLPSRPIGDFKDFKYQLRS